MRWLCKEPTLLFYLWSVLVHTHSADILCCNRWALLFVLGRVRDLIMKRFMGGYRPKACAQALGPKDCIQLACNVPYMLTCAGPSSAATGQGGLLHTAHLLPCACALWLHACSASCDYDADASLHLIMVQDAFNKPVASAPDAYIQVLERNPPDGQK